MVLNDNRTRTFVLGAGFSVAQGFPLVKDLRSRVEDFLRAENHSLYAGLLPQYEQLSQEFDRQRGTKLGFEELFVQMLIELPQAR